MKKSLSAFLGLPVAILTVAGVSLGFQDAVPAPQVGNIGVVNAMRALNAHPKFIQGRANLQKMDEAFWTGAKQLENAIEQLSVDIASLDAGALDLREAKSFELDMLRRNLEGLGVIHERRRARFMASISVSLYPDIWEAAAKVAANQGLTLVLRKRKLIPGVSLENDQRQHDRLTVVYAAAGMDVTDDVIALLK